MTDNARQLACLLSNGRYTTLINAAGAGFSRCHEVALNRWSGDLVEDAEGFFIYVRDLDTGEYWSVGRQPTVRPPERYEAGGATACFVVEREDTGIVVRMEVAVSPHEDFELRRLSLRNHSGRVRRIELTSYVEVVLNHPAADAAHPAFSKLFVQTEQVDGVLLAHRRPRSAGETGLWMVHALSAAEGCEYETDRTRFIGRGGSLARPSALTGRQPLSGHAGNVLDPVFSFRRVFELPAGERTELVFLLGAAENREEGLALAERCRDREAVAAVFHDAVDVETARRAALGRFDERVSYFQSLIGAILYGQPCLRAPQDVLTRSGGSRVQLERYGLSPWIPLVVVAAAGPEDAKVPALIAARRYWEALGVRVSLLILADEGSWEVEEGEPVVAHSAADLPRNEFDAVLSLASLVVWVHWPRLAVGWYEERNAPAPPSPKDEQGKRVTAKRRGGKASAASATGSPALTEHSDLRCFNGYGGFSTEGDEYVIRLDRQPEGTLRRPPLAWINTIANEGFGFLVSESGAGYTWSRNSREHRLTPWSNDPLVDPHGEAWYVRDEQSGKYWSPTPGPTPADGDYEVAHGFGYSRFRHRTHELELETTMFVPRHDPLKIVHLRVRNLDGKARRFSLFSYARLVLGSIPADHARFVVTDFCAVNETLFATNRFAGEFADGVAFAAVVCSTSKATYYSGDRADFLGMFGSPAHPAALVTGYLNNVSGAGLDPCAALQASLEIEAGAEVECSFLLGETIQRADALALVAQYRKPDAIMKAFEDVRAFWRDTVGAVRIRTPVPAIDFMVNGWLTYQNLACRIWGRSAFYQSGGAYGYRDQLQDAGALIYSRPDLTRAQIVLHAGHQFVEGDVLHWWHPEPINRGLRTRFSDDLLWLPFITAFYTRSTGDYDVLDEMAPFLTARALAEGEDECYLSPQDSGTPGDIYEHCCRALDRSMTEGAHGLPLMGTGDWNDGMNRVGRLGRGESVWMGFFLYRTLADFLPLCERRGDVMRIARYTVYRQHLARVLNEAGWDGAWYRRAFYDDGTVLGSKKSDECQIDALAQAWAVISEVASAERARLAIDAVEERLVLDPPGIIRLLTPAFVDTPHDPGYIKGYVAGVRENGGQYTHAACWVVRAMAELGRGGRAAELLERLTPVYHARDPQAVAEYQVEPYVVVADIYGEPPHVGRGGWTWYTGSAGWMYRVALESVLGFTVEGGDMLTLRPRIPDHWPEVAIDWRAPGDRTHYHVFISNPDLRAAGVRSVSLDGQVYAVKGGIAYVPLSRDGGQHRIDVILGAD